MIGHLNGCMLFGFRNENKNDALELLFWPDPRRRIKRANYQQPKPVIHDKHPTKVTVRNLNLIVIMSHGKNIILTRNKTKTFFQISSLQQHSKQELGAVVRRLDSAVRWIVIFSTVIKCLKSYKTTDMDFTINKTKL
jgi:hypothetical protein